MRPKPTISAKLAQQAAIKLQAFEKAQKRQFIINLFGYSGLGFIAILLVMLLGGERFSPFLNAIGLEGLYNEKQGVYADCSRSANQNNPFCTGVTPPQEEAWKNIKSSGAMRSAPFSLSN